MQIEQVDIRYSSGSNSNACVLYQKQYLADCTRLTSASRSVADFMSASVMQR